MNRIATHNSIKALVVWYGEIPPIGCLLTLGDGLDHHLGEVLLLQLLEHRVGRAAAALGGRVARPSPGGAAPSAAPPAPADGPGGRGGGRGGGV